MEDFASKLIIQKNKKRHKTIRMPKSLNSFLQTQTLTNWQGRIVFSILNLIRSSQIIDGKTPTGELQLDLFRMFWDHEDSSVTFNFNFSDFVPINTQYKREQIEQALKDLVTIGLSEQEEEIQGKTKKRFTGIIFNPIWDEKSHSCSFQMTASWFKIFVIATQYETWLFEETLQLSARARKFLLLLNQYEFKGSFWKYRKDLCEYFNSKAIPISLMEKDFLFPIRAELDKKGELSFNWKYEKTADKLEFAIYRLKNAQEGKTIPRGISSDRNIIEEKKIEINSAIKYIIKARELNEEQKNIFFTVCLKYGYDEIKSIIKNTTKNNVENSFKNIKGQNFIDKILCKYPI